MYYKNDEAQSNFLALKAIKHNLYDIWTKETVKDYVNKRQFDI